METEYLNQRIADIRKEGYVKFANREFALELMAAMPRPEFDDIQYVGGVGKWAVEGYIFMPHAAREITARIKRELLEVRAWERSYRRALAYMAGLKPPKPRRPKGRESGKPPKGFRVTPYVIKYDSMLKGWYNVRVWRGSSVVCDGAQTAFETTDEARRVGIGYACDIFEGKDTWT